jgi:hypothetical protein
MGFDFDDCLYCALLGQYHTPDTRRFICLTCMDDLDLNDRMLSVVQESLTTSAIYECVSCHKQAKMVFQMTVGEGCVERYKE